MKPHIVVVNRVKCYFLSAHNVLSIPCPGDLVPFTSDTPRLHLVFKKYIHSQIWAAYALKLLYTEGKQHTKTFGFDFGFALLQ